MLAVLLPLHALLVLVLLLVVLLLVVLLLLLLLLLQAQRPLRADPRHDGAGAAGQHVGLAVLLSDVTRCCCCCWCCCCWCCCCCC
jgi:hypothetical protein